MQIKKTLLSGFFFLTISLSLFAQADRISLGDKQYQLLDRLDIKLQNDSVLSFSTIKPFNRRIYTERVSFLDSLDQSGALPAELSVVDRQNMQNLLMNNSDWTKDEGRSFREQHRPVWNTFFKTPAHLYEVHTGNFNLIIDPVLNLQVGKSSEVGKALYANTRGFSLRGNIAKKVGFYTYLTDNQENDPLYVQRYINQHRGIPYAGYYKTYANNIYDYFDARGGIDFSVSKYFNFRFGYDKLFIGNGYRSLMLSDFSNNFLYLEMDVQLRRFSYKSVYAEIIAPFNPIPNRDTIRYKNYMAFHHLSLQLTRWLNLGLYENIVYNGHHGIELSYLNPVLFYRVIEMQLGSGNSKATVGIDVKANLLRRLQLYGQLALSEFVIKELKNYKNGSWMNKQAIQLGGKYIDVAGVNNLDLQVEMNLVRPFMYTHNDSNTAFVHYNKELAHPLGANFAEYIALIKYQPVPRLYFTGKLIAYRQGLDSAGENMGNNLFRSYLSRPRDYGFYIGTGIPVNSRLLSFTASYEFLQNLYIDLSLAQRNFNVSGKPEEKEFFFNMGVRWNIAKKEFEF